MQKHRLRGIDSFYLLPLFPPPRPLSYPNLSCLQSGGRKTRRSAGGQHFNTVGYNILPLGQRLLPLSFTAKMTTFVDTPLAWLIAFACSTIGFIISSYNIVKHSRTYTQPNKQRCIIRILGIVPVYAVGSWFSLVFHDRALYFDTIRDIYEAWVIYSFLNLILAYGGGENECCLAMAQNPGSIKHPFPLCCLPPVQLGSNFLRACKRGCLQFVVIKPIFACLSFVMYGMGTYDSPAYQGILTFVYNVSYTVALYALLLFYLATSNILENISPVFKFFAVKLVVFATYYQSLAVAAVPGVPHETSQRWNNFVLCCEMSIFAVLHAVAYPWKEFTQGAMVTSFYSAFADAVNIKDVGRDLGTNFDSRYQNYAAAGGGALVSPAIALSERRSSGDRQGGNHPIVSSTDGFDPDEDIINMSVMPAAQNPATTPTASEAPADIPRTFSGTSASESLETVDIP